MIVPYFRFLKDIFITKAPAFSKCFLMAETVGFEPTGPVTAQRISSAPRYDRFDTSPSPVLVYRRKGKKSSPRKVTGVSPPRELTKVPVIMPRKAKRLQPMVLKAICAVEFSSGRFIYRMFE